MPLYSYALNEEAVHAFTLLAARPRQKLLHTFESLARHPGQKGDYKEPGVSGRLYEVKLIDDVLITWWTDHAAREVRVVRIESID